MAVAVVVALLPGCADRDEPSVPLTLESLAAGWSGGRTDPTCRNTGPRGEYLGGYPPGTEYCQWPTLIRGAEWGRVGGMRDPRDGFASITWERFVTDSSEVARLADSLSMALAEAGLDAYPCRNGGRRWQRAGLGVHLDPGPPRSDGRRLFLVFATTIPTALPGFACPAAPRLPGTVPQAPRRTAGSPILIGIPS